MLRSLDTYRVDAVVWWADQRSEQVPGLETRLAARFEARHFYNPQHEKMLYVRRATDLALLPCAPS